MKRLLRLWAARLYARLSGKADDWMDETPTAAGGPKTAKAERLAGFVYEPDAVLEELRQPVQNPVLALIEAVKSGRAEVVEAHLFEARVNEDGRLMPERLRESASGVHEPTYRMRRVRGSAEFLAKVEESARTLKALPDKAALAKHKKREALRQVREKLKAAKLREDFVDRTSIMDGVTTSYDQAQFTEYTPIMGGPFYRQLYMFDHLRSVALAFEAYHHNPICNRIVSIFSQYVLGRGFKLTSKDQDYLDAVEQVVKDLNIRRKLRQWFVEFMVYGELLLDNERWVSIDPSTVWQIVHEPDDVSKPLYYWQSYPTDYMMYTGIKVPGVPAAEKTPSMRYIVRQLPFDRVMHIKANCVSNEVRGRSFFFPIHGWLKRYKDLLTAEVIHAQLQAAFVWDVEIKGSDADVQNYAQNYSGMPVPGSVEVHNENVKRTPQQAMTGSSMSRGSGVAETLLALIATSQGLPKEHLNVISSGGSRATALVGSEPFTKAVEEKQVVFRELIHDILSIELPRHGLDYRPDILEVIFPSITKDTTTEIVKNISMGEAQGYITKRTAGALYATEMDIADYDFEAEQEQMQEDKAAGLDQVGDVPAPASRFGGPGDQPGGGSEIHGDGKSELQDTLGTL